MMTSINQLFVYWQFVNKEELGLLLTRKIKISHLYIYSYSYTQLKFSSWNTHTSTSIGLKSKNSFREFQLPVTACFFLCGDLPALCDRFFSLFNDLSALCGDLPAMCDSFSTLCGDLTALCEDLSALCGAFSALFIDPICCV